MTDLDQVAAEWEKKFEEHPELMQSATLRWTKYIPHTPLPKQRAFLMLPDEEAFFGGAAGPGKSDALLMGALQYVDVPRYSALILRKTIQDLTLPGALIDRSRAWLEATDAKFNGQTNAWNFPSGAKLQFGYMKSINDRFRYQGGEYQYIAFDELTHFNQVDYEYLRSRLRRATCPVHGEQPDKDCPDCKEYGQLAQVPLRMRAASNPGGIGHNWVRDYFKIERTDLQQYGRPIYMGTHPERPHIPAFLEDNPYINPEEYKRQLKHLDVVTMEQLLAGNWGINADGRFKTKWAKFFSENGDYIILGPDKCGEAVLRHEITIFMLVDPAASSKDVIDDPAANKVRSNTAIGLFGLTCKGDLIVLKFHITQEEITDVLKTIHQWYVDFRPAFLGMEYTVMSRHIYQIMQRAGFTMRAFIPNGRDKVSRSADISQRMNNGQVYFPQWDTPWRTTLFNELFTWTGHPSEKDDQVDVMSYAGIYAAHEHQYGPKEFRVDDDWWYAYEHQPEAYQ
jgi:predicted phage terminase large subunit-like protein